MKIRMARLERTVRLQRVMVLLVGMMVAAPFVGAAGLQHQSVITCSGIVVDRTDSSGQVKILPNGIFIGNKNSQKAILIQTNDRENSINFQDGTGSDVLGLYSNGTDSFINASSPAGSIEATAGVAGASLTLRDKDGNDRARMGFDGSPTGKGALIGLYDAAAKVLWETTPSKKKN